MTGQKTRVAFVAVLFVTLLWQPSAAGRGQNPATSPNPGIGQAPAAQVGTRRTVPRLLPVSGRLLDPSGAALTGVVRITLAVYSEQDSTDPLWTEQQAIELDANGRYTVLLGATQPDGVPVHLFTSGEARWLGTTVEGEQERPRGLLLTVPYALKALDTDMLGGKPAAEFAGAASKTDEGLSASAAPGGGGGGGEFTANSFRATVEDAPGFSAETRIGPPLVVRSTGLVANLNADLFDGFDASAFPKLAISNTFTTHQTINGTLTATFGNFLNGVSSTVSSDGSSAIRGQATNTMGQGFGVSGTTAASVNLSAGVYGGATNPNAFTHGVFGESMGTGAAIRGIGRHAVSGIGVEGISQGSSGIALFGQVPATTGTGIGLVASVNSATGIAGLFQNNGGGTLIVGRTSGTDRFRVDGSGAVYATSFRDLATGAPIPNGDVTGVTAGTGLTGGGASGDVSLALDTAFTDARYVRPGITNFFTAKQSIDTAASGTQALFARNTAGMALQAEGTSYGAFGYASAAGGTGVYAVSATTSNGGVGVYGEANSAAAIASVAHNKAGGMLFSGRTGGGGSEVFRVDGTGAVFANSYRDLSGNPIGTGDVTGVTAGTGLTGGGASGDVTIGLDTAFTDARYAAAAHGHNVSEIADAARLSGGNSFTGDQSVSGNLLLTSLLSAGRASLSAGTTSEPILSVNQTGSHIGIHARVANTAGSTAIFGEATPSTGTGRGVHGRANSPNAVGVFGDNSFGGFGVHGLGAGINSVGVRGEAANLSGLSFGVRGTSTSSSGIGASGEALAAIGTTIGVRATVASAAGVAGLFDNSAGGDLLLASAGGAQRFRVDGTGAVFANSFRDLSGNPIGTGDVTGVTAGTGLTGGGASGDVTLALDTAFSDARYAAAAHGHDVTEVANAARLTGSNAFSGLQTIAGALGVSGNVSGWTANFSNSSSGNAVTISQNTAGNALFGTTSSSGHAAVFGRNTSGAGSGLHGEAGALGVFGMATSTSGTSVDGVFGWATGASGFNSGVRGRTDSAAGVGGLFENAAGGLLLVGRVGFAEKFRVDGTGAVYANSYRDLAGNPIAAGTVTNIETGMGLTGGPISSSGTIALDTAFTDARYSMLGHGHNVGEIANAATLGGNTFNGNQAITGDLSASGALTVGTAVLSATNSSQVLSVAQNGTGFAGRFTGNTEGTLVQVIQAGNGGGLLGQAPGGFAIQGFHTGTNGSGVVAVANGSTGSTRGLSATVRSPGGIAGLFDNMDNGGVLLSGRANNVERFKVDGGGNVYATAYKDLAGNPIVGGDVTGVTAGAGLTGGGASGDVTLALDTAFTDARYSMASHGHDVSQITNAARLTANTFTGNQTIQAGNISLDSSTASTGNITKNGIRFLHNFGNLNAFVGEQAGNLSMTGFGNSGFGYTTLLVNAGGSQNTALGASTLQSNTGGSNNTAAGVTALQSNSTGHGNTAIGVISLNHNDSGGFNVGVGFAAGFNATTGSNNIYLGARVQGVAGESNTMYLGRPGTQTKTVIAGVRGITTVNPDAIPVVIDSAGQLGTISSSRRFKEDIRDMADASARLLQLRPVTFRYAQAFGDRSKPTQFGLIAEEVAEVFPELVVRNTNGEVETVQYQTLSVLLLNEVQKQQRRIEALERRIEELLAARQPAGAGRQ